jgi:Putative auto-transporter adhesin, head GIN domain
MSMLRRIWRRGLRNSPPHLPLPANYAKPYAMTKAFLPAVILATTGLALTPLMAVPQSNAAGAISRDYMVSSIATLILEGDIAATLIHDPRAKMIATGQPTDVDRLNIRRNGRSLRISMTQSGQTYQRKGPITLELRSADVEAITLNGGASLTVDRLDQQRITIGLFGSGALAVGEVKADRLRVNMVGNGAATVRKGQVGKADFILDGMARGAFGHGRIVHQRDQRDQLRPDLHHGCGEQHGGDSGLWRGQHHHWRPRAMPHPLCPAGQCGLRGRR